MKEIVKIDATRDDKMLVSNKRSFRVIPWINVLIHNNNGTTHKVDGIVGLKINTIEKKASFDVDIFSTTIPFIISDKLINKIEFTDSLKRKTTMTIIQRNIGIEFNESSGCYGTPLISISRIKFDYHELSVSDRYEEQDEITP